MKIKSKRPKRLATVFLKKFKHKDRSRNYMAYKKWRTTVYRRDKFTCRCCGKVGGMLNAHHILNYSKHTKLRLKLSNGITLCIKCHNKFHKRFGKRNNTLKQLKVFFNKVGGKKHEN